MQSFRFFQDWWAEVTHGAENGGSISKMIGPSPSTVDIWAVYFTYTLTILTTYFLFCGVPRLAVR